MKRRLLTLVLVAALAGSAGAAAFDKVEYYKNAQPGQKKGDSVKGGLVVEEKEIRFQPKRGDTLAIPVPAIKHILYERASKPRYAEGILIAWPLLLTKSKKHYLTIHYTGADGAGQYALLRLDKSNVRETLAEIEARTGRKIERLEER